MSYDVAALKVKPKMTSYIMPHDLISNLVPLTICFVYCAKEANYSI